MQETRSSTSLDEPRELAHCKTLGISHFGRSVAVNAVPELRIHVLRHVRTFLAAISHILASLGRWLGQAYKWQIPSARHRREGRESVSSKTEK